jgi:hypothetical protein
MRTSTLGRGSLVLLLALYPSATSSWGSLYPGETHQFILDAAYTRLEADPAFAPSLFPPLERIKHHEGVEWTVEGLSGVGPDARGMSAYADHYYNPVTSRGNGPDASSKYFAYLAQQNAAHTVLTEAAAKAAAWSAHFLADMFVPYHVVGTTRDQAERIWSTQTKAHPGVINLGFDIIGSFTLSYAAPITGGDRNFNTELSRFITRTDPREADWFDAWYYNGITEARMVQTSSHVAWEAAPSYSLRAPATIIGDYQQRAGLGLPGYAPAWTNAGPAFGRPWDDQARRARALAVASATETRARLESYFDDPAPALADAVRSVYSIWRASFSGLRPTIDARPDGPNRHKIIVTVANHASASVQAVQVRLSAEGCTVAAPAVRPVGGTIATGAQTATAPWEVSSSDGSCRLTADVVGSYPIPDLQFATVTRTLAASPSAPAADVRSAVPPASAPEPIPATGAWVLERTEFELQKIDADLEGKARPHESGSDGGGTAEGTFGHPDPRVFVTVRMKCAWTSPPKVLVPGRALDFRVTAADAGSDDIRGLFLGGSCSLGANSPATSSVWYGPATSFDLHKGDKQNSTTKPFTPARAPMGSTMWIGATFGVGIRRAEYRYIYKFAPPGTVPATTATAPAEPSPATSAPRRERTAVAETPVAGPPPPTRPPDRIPPVRTVQPPAAPAAPPREVFNNMNTGACSFTNAATFTLPASVWLRHVSIWYNWRSNEQSVGYTLTSGKEVLRSGELTRGGCDPFQGAWCAAVVALDMDVPAGTYSVTVARSRVCQNAGTGGNGAVVVTATPRPGR